MSGDDDRTLRIMATLGLAIAGPATLLTGILAAVTIPTGVNRALVTVFLISAIATAVFALLFLNDHVRHSR